MSDEATQEQAAESPSQPTVTSAPVAISDASWEAATGAWINSHVRNSPMAVSESWNHLSTVLPRLRELLETELRRASAP